MVLFRTQQCHLHVPFPVVRVTEGVRAQRGQRGLCWDLWWVGMCWMDTGWERQPRKRHMTKDGVRNCTETNSQCFCLTVPNATQGPVLNSVHKLPVMVGLWAPFHVKPPPFVMSFTFTSDKLSVSIPWEIQKMLSLFLVALQTPQWLQIFLS